MRTITPFVLGMTRAPFLEFLLLNTLSAAAWATLIDSLGFVFGHGLELMLSISAIMTYGLCTGDIGRLSGLADASYPSLLRQPFQHGVIIVRNAVAKQ